MSQSTKRKRLEDHYGDTSVPAEEASESEEEFDFENIDLDQVPKSESQVSLAGNTSNEHGIAIRLAPKTNDEGRKRYPTTAIARKIRLEIHKVHLLCLLSHVALRNKWCSDEEIMNILRPLKSRLTKVNIHPKTTSAQIQRTRVLLEGLEQVSDFWAKSYKVTQNGLTKPKWYAEDDLSKVLSAGSHDEINISRDDFVIASRNLRGDRDIGAQLLVTLLRLLGLETRLVCSLQPLAISVGRTNTATIIAESATAMSETENITTANPNSPGLPEPPQPRKLTRPKLGFARQKTAVVRPKPQIQVARPVVQSSYPIYWAEVFDSAAQKWYPIDPLVTGSVNKPNSFEPPQSESANTLSYVVAFGRDGSARDVTHRYTKQFNAKVRKQRLEGISQTGSVWWSRIMKFHAPRELLDRDAIEAAELAQKQLSEGIPINVGDLKGHPLFVIERHLRKNEIIQPRRECGTITVGKSRPPVVEKVYPRKFVQSLRSSIAWYMRGRQVRPGEQPLKFIPRKARFDVADLDEPAVIQDSEREGLYSEAQTEVYVPQAVREDQVPKNAYGNIDLFVPSMLPPGSVHFGKRNAEQAAQLLGVDYAVAITGFDHANRQTVPIKQGVVVASGFADAMREVQDAIHDEAVSVAERSRALTALTRWSHFLQSLRIRRHVQSRYGDGDDSVRDDDDPVAEEDDGLHTGGGFM